MGLQRCVRCKRVLIEEEFAGHQCTAEINGKIVKIPVDRWIEGKHPQTGEKLISATAFDGTTYWIVQTLCRPSDRVPFDPCHGNFNTGFKHGKNKHNPNIGSNQYSSKLLI